jgi:hypothetical protein
VANYASSVLVNAQAKLATKYNEAELRRKNRPVIDMATKNVPYCLPDHQSIRVSENRTVEVKYLKKRTAGSATAKVALHTGTKGDSGTLNLSWNSLVETFYTSRKQAQNNVISFEAMFQHELEQAIQNIKDRAETAGVASVFSNRSQINNTTVVAASAGTAAAWNTTNKAVDVASGSASYFAQVIRQVMTGRLYQGQYDVLTDLIQYGAFERTMNQGAGNSTNTSFQFANMNIAPTVDTMSGAYSAGQALVMPAGSFAGLVWNDPMNRKGIEAGENAVGTFGTLIDPFGSGLIFDISHYVVRADESSNGGGVQDVQDQWEVTLNIAWAVPPISTSSDSAIHLFAQG